MTEILFLTMSLAREKQMINKQNKHIKYTSPKLLISENELFVSLLLVHFTTNAITTDKRSNM